MLPANKQDRKETPIYSGVLNYFPDAIAAVAHVSFIGNQQHNPGQALHWSRGKSDDHADCVARHLIQSGTTDDDGTLHTAKAAWRCLAMLQLEIEANNAAAAEEKANISAKVLKYYTPLVYTSEMPSPPRLSPGLPNDPALELWGWGGKRWMEILKELGCSKAVAEGILAGTSPSQILSAVVSGVTYIAGPMRGYPKYNFPAFDAARDELTKQNWIVISPADIDRHSKDDAPDIDPTTGGDVADTTKYVYRDFMALMLLAKLKAHGRAVRLTLLDGWSESVGATSEYHLAKWLKIPYAHWNYRTEMDAHGRKEFVLKGCVS